MRFLIKLKYSICLTFATTALFTANIVIADKPGWDDGGRHEKHRPRESHRDWGRHGYQYPGQPAYRSHDRPPYHGGKFFDDRDHSFVNGYFANEHRSGRCPPGLDKKYNGCLPPGREKKWLIGQPIAGDIVYYDLPPSLAMGIGLPPPGYRFVRVASDILLIAIGTGIVMDAIYDLGSR